MNKFVKRAIDVTLSIICLIVLSPLLITIAILVWMDTPGPVIFSQNRIGQNGKIFRIHKFRKFPTHWKNEGPCVTLRKDPRMTPIGAILERTKLDELPQLWNILKGEMSFVGPRPEHPKFIDLYTGKFGFLLCHRPGIFGPNQILFRNESERYVKDEDPESFYRRVLFYQKAENDFGYFNDSNIFKDLMIILVGSVITLVGILNWKRFFKVHFLIIATDGLLIAASWTIAYTLRFSAIPAEENLTVMLTGIKIIPPLIITGLLICRCYRCQLKYFTLTNATRLGIVIIFSWLATFFILIKLYRSISLYLLPMSASLSIIFLLIPRVFARWFWENRINRKRKSGIEILIYGAGKTGMALADCFPIVKFIGFIDDNPDYRGVYIRGLKVYGHESDIPTIHKVRPFKELWVTFEPSPQKRHRLFQTCESSGIKLVFFSEIEPFSTLKAEEKLSVSQNYSCQP